MTPEESTGTSISENSEIDGIAWGKTRSDCAPEQIDLLLQVVEETKNVAGDILEVGSYRCGATVAMAASNPAKNVYAFDLFGGLPYPEHPDFRSFGETDFEEIAGVVRNFPNIVLVRGRHELTVPEFAKAAKPVSLLFMDSDFYSSHLVSLLNFWPLIPLGGAVVFHDWTFEDVQLAVKQTINPADCVYRGSSVNMGMVMRTSFSRAF
jgi:hypothetical protein